MKRYPSQAHGNRIHTIRVTFQNEGFIGHIAYKSSGSCVGLDVLDFYPSNICQSDINFYVLNDCDFSIDKRSGLFSIELFDEKGQTMKSEFNKDELSNCVIAIEIADWRYI